MQRIHCEWRENEPKDDDESYLICQLLPNIDTKTLETHKQQSTKRSTSKKSHVCSTVCVSHCFGVYGTFWSAAKWLSAQKVNFSAQQVDTKNNWKFFDFLDTLRVTPKSSSHPHLLNLLNDLCVIFTNISSPNLTFNSKLNEIWRFNKNWNHSPEITLKTLKIATFRTIFYALLILVPWNLSHSKVLGESKTPQIDTREIHSGNFHAKLVKIQVLSLRMVLLSTSSFRCNRLKTKSLAFSLFKVIHSAIQKSS